MSEVLKTAFPFELVENETVFILRDIVPRYEYDENNRRTSNIVGYSYDCINTASYNQYNVIVEQSAPLMERQELLSHRENGDNVFVTFTNARIRAYFSKRSNRYEDSVRADKASLVTTS